MTTKLDNVLSKLSAVVKSEGVVAMNAEALTTYAAEQVTKFAADSDGGAARRAHLVGVITDALDVLKHDVTAEVEFVPFAEQAPAPTSALDPNIAALTKTVADLAALVAKAVPPAVLAEPQANENTSPTETTIHPPPVPAGAGASDKQLGSSVSTNQPQGDDGTPRDELTKGLGSDTASTGGVAVNTDEDDLVWPGDMTTKDFMAGVTKRDDVRPLWGYDNERAPNPVAAPAN